MKWIVWFDDERCTDVALVGGKNASLATMIQSLSPLGIMIPSGFAITSHGFRAYLDANNLTDTILQELKKLSEHSTAQEIQTVGKKIRAMVEAGDMPHDLSEEIVRSYRKLSRTTGVELADVAVRSSATAEDLPTASFAGQQETYLHIRGEKSLLAYCKKGFASLYTDRAISYRIQKGFKHERVALSLGIQTMIRSDLASSGVAFSLDTESGFKDAIVINASFGLGEAIVQGLVTPDEYWVYKPTVASTHYPILKKTVGSKKVKLVYGSNQKNPIKKERISAQQSGIFCLNDHEIIDLARQVARIEQFFSEQKGSWCPVDVEWAKDGKEGPIYIVQARPETIHSRVDRTKAAVTYRLLETSDVLAVGISIGKQITVGTVRLVNTFEQVKKVQAGDIVVTPMTQPDWVPLLSKAAGIITFQGGRTCHAAIVSRELGIPAIVGVQQGKAVFKNRMKVTLDCSSGLVGTIYSGALSFEKVTVPLNHADTVNALQLMLSDPRQAFQSALTPNSGVGLLRLEFAIAQSIKIHPLACVPNSKALKVASIAQKIDRLTAAYDSPADYYVQLLRQTIATIAAAFNPKRVFVRLSDFKSNEYASLLGGTLFESAEENPMLGFRGCRRYYDPHFRSAFALECQAIDFVRNRMGFKNVHILVPFVREPAEAEKVLAILASYGLQSHQDGLAISMMVETPENVLMLEKYAPLFDHFSLGTNDLTQLTLGVDRDNATVAQLFDESNPAVLALIAQAIALVHAHGKKISVCGQGPSDNPKLAQHLLKMGIDTLVVTQDALLGMLSK